MTQTENVNNNPALPLAIATMTGSKNKKQEGEQLLQLLSFVEQLKEELESLGSKSQAAQLFMPTLDVPTEHQTPAAVTPPPPPPPPPGRPSNNFTSNNESNASNSLINALANAAYFLSEIEAEIVGKYSLAATTDETQIMQNQRAASEQAFDNTNQQIIQIEQEQEEESSESVWQKFLSVFASVFTVVLSIVCAQPEIATLMVITTILNETGATNKIIGNSLGATIAMSVVTALISGGTGALAGGVRLAAALAVENVVQMLTATNGLTNILNSIPMSDAEREKVTMYVTICLAAVAIAASVYGGSAMIKNAAADVEEGAEEGTSIFSKLKAAYRNTIARLKYFLNTNGLSSPTIMMELRNLTRNLSIASSALQGVQGYQMIQTGAYTRDMMDGLATVQLMQTLMNMTSRAISDRQSIVSNQLQQSQSNQQVISSWLAGERAFAQTYAQAAG